MATTESSIDDAMDAATVPTTRGTGPTAGDDFVVPPGVKQPRKSAWGVFREMPILVKLGVIWLFLIFFGAIYAQLDVRVFNGSLPLADPNLQLNNFNPATGQFGTAKSLGVAVVGPSARAPTPWLATRSPGRCTARG